MFVHERKEKLYKIWIVPVPENVSDGKWDLRVTIKRLEDNKVKESLFSGSFEFAHYYGISMIENFDNIDNGKITCPLCGSKVQPEKD